MGRTSRELASWSESQDWQERFWWPFHQKSALRDLAYGGCVWTGECAGAGTEDLPRYILAALEVTRDQVKKEMDRGWLRGWGDTFALVCIILCLLEAATRVSVAFGRGLRVTSHAVKHYLEDRRRQGCPAGAWQPRIFEPEEGPAAVDIAPAIDILPQANLN